jgi:hypothetical protein
MLKSISSITNAIGALNYKGTWNASTNTPTLASGVGTKGDYYVVSVAGSTTLDGISNWGVGDLATYNGTVWQRVEGGADLNGVNLSVSGTTTLSGLTASTALALDASKNVVSVTNTGTGNNVLATAPTLVGDVSLSTGNLVIGTSGKGVAYPVTTGGSALAPAFSAYRNTTQTITSGVYTKVQLNAETFDTNSNFDSVTNFRFTPTVAGYYQINGKISSSGSTVSTSMAAAIYKNGSIYKYGPYIQAPSAESNVQDIVYFNGSTDYVELFVYITATTAVIGTGAENTYFSGVLIRGA